MVGLSALDFDLYQIIDPVLARATEDFANDAVDDQDRVVASRLRRALGPTIETKQHEINTADHRYAVA